MQPQDFQERLAQMPEDKRNQMLQMLKLLSAPPETLLNLFERVGVRWERRYLDSENYPDGAMVIDWRSFTKAEAINQQQGPIMKRMLTEEFGEQANPKQIGDVVREMRPTEFNPPSV
jgi:hypothetical protein